ncbi:MAG: hypothetical protein K0B87_00440 [Candidatus Syntrophosphaera sp.]|nr:hypothetical protein [Candidatus Syntrophosphaera sp.]
MKGCAIAVLLFCIFSLGAENAASSVSEHPTQDDHFLSVKSLEGEIPAGAGPGGDPQRLVNTWDGSFNTSWDVASNWSLNEIPNSSHDVVIPASMPRYPVVSTTAYCYSLTLNSGYSSNLTIEAGNLWVYNDFNSYSNLTMNSSSGNLYVLGALSFRSLSSVTMNANATIRVHGNLEFQSGSAVNMGNGTLSLEGSGTDSWIFVYQAGTVLNNLRSAKSAPYLVNISSYSNNALTINGSLQVYPGSKLIHAYTGNTYLQGNLEVQTTGSFQLAAGTLVFSGNANATLNTPNSGDFFNHLTINKGGAYSVSLISHINVRGNLSIQSGTLNTVQTVGSPPIYHFHNITLGGNWMNYIGPAAFIEGTGTGTVTLNGTGTQTLSSENFCNLVLNMPQGLMSIGGATVACASYNWISGAYSVHGGTFTVNDLVNPGIFGTILLSAGTINYHQDTAAGSYVDLNAFLDISGGTFNIHGGNQYSVFGRGAPATLSLSGNGVLDFKDVGIIFTTSYSFTDVIGGGTIRTAERFIGDRNDFNPYGGTIELYGSASCEFRLAVNSNFHNVTINKTSAASVITGQGIFDINGDFRLQGGTFIAPPTMFVAGNWTNLAGPAAFGEGSGTVTIDGSLTQTMTTETFTHLVLNKSGGTMIIPTGVTVLCSTYDWTAGAITVSGGIFVASDLIDPGIFGTITLTSGFIEFFQDSAQRIDLRGSLTISGGQFVVHGGSASASFSYIDVATLTLSGGGVLDFMNVGIVIPAGYQFIANISGGTIRTGGSFYVNRSDFNPSGGTVELYGSANTQVSNVDGSSFHHLTVNKASSLLAVSGNGPVHVTGNLTLQSGNFYTSSLLNLQNGGNTTINSNSSLRLDNGSMISTGNVAINNGGSLYLEYNASLALGAGKSLAVNNGGLLNAFGDQANQPLITCLSPSGHYGLNIESGAMISARRSVFELMDAWGLNIKNGALVDPSQALDYCTFRNGAPGGTLLTVNSSQAFPVTGAIFPANTWGGAHNVSKTVNQGSITFVDYACEFSGPAYENDPYNRIHWVGAGSPITDLSITHIPATNRIQLDWISSVAASSYKIYRAASPDGVFTEVGTSATTSWSEPVPGALYFYRVTAVLP